MRREFLTDEEVESEITRLTVTPEVKLARREQRLKYKRRQQLYLLAQTGICIGEEVNLIYLAAGEKDYRNESREFMLKRAGENPLEELQSGETELKLPPQLLADAHIPLDADLDIVCLDRKIVILPTEDVESEDVPKELLDICAELGIPREKVNIVLRMTEEGSDEKAGV